MSEENTAVAAEEATPETATETEQPTLDSIEKQYYPSASIEAASAAIEQAQTIAESVGAKVTYNFNINDDFPQGYGILVDTITKRKADGSGNEAVGVLVAALPDFETVQNDEQGAKFIREKTIDAMTAKLKNAVRPRGEDGAVSASVPMSVTDFVTSSRPEGVLVAFRQMAGAYVKLLKKRGLSMMTEAILRQTLQSAAFAEQNFPKVTQDKWVTILDSMIANAKKENLATGIMEEWKQTRDSAELPTADIDLADLDFSAVDADNE